MKLILTSLFLSFISWADVDPNVTQMISVLPAKVLNNINVRGDYRYRAYLTSIEEGGVHLFIDKVSISDEGNSILWKKEIKYLDEKSVSPLYKSLAPEAQMFCCEISDISWNQKKLSFKTKIKSNVLSCDLADAEDPKLQLSCK